MMRATVRVAVQQPGGNKMTTKISLTYCGMEGDGATVKLAKQDAARKIEAALAGTYTPAMIRAGSMIGIIWREPKHGWAYKIICESDPAGSFRGYTMAHGSDFHDTRADCARHMAQLAGNYK